MSDTKQETAVVWAALEKIAGKERRRELLQPGAKHNVALSVSGSIDDRTIDRRKIAGVLSVGHDSTRTSSSGPGMTEVVGYLLAKLNPRTREKILRTLPEEFAAGENTMPVVDGDILESAKNLLGRLRAKQTVSAKGPVSFHYTVACEE